MAHAPSWDARQLEKRRRRAVQLLESGWTLSAVARQAGAAVSSVFRWWRAYQRKGLRGLEAKPRPERPSQLGKAEASTRDIARPRRAACRVADRALDAAARMTELIH
jgi:transposase